MALIAVPLAALAASTAFAQSRDLQPLLDRLERMERDIRTLNLQRSGTAPVRPGETRQTPAAPPATDNQGLARIEVRLTAMEEELRAATGRDEELSYRLDQLAERLDKLVADVDFRLSTLEQSMQARPPGAPSDAPPRLSAAPSPPSVTTATPQGAAEPGVLGTISPSDLAAVTVSTKDTKQAPAPVEAAPKILPDGTPRERYTHAFGLLGRARYDEAERALLAFLDVHGDDPLAVNARYWLGETYYVRGDFARAAEVFLEAFQKDPRGNKAPDTLLKLGMALGALNKSNEACAAFAKLGQDFPKAPANIQSTVTRERRKNRC